MVDELEYVTDAHRRMYHLIDSVALWQSVNGHLRLLLALLRGREPERVLRRLAALGMEAAGLAAWLAFDLRDHSAREHHFALAFELSGVARDSPLTAYVRSFRSVTEYVEDRPHRALALARQAGEEGAGATATTRAWLAGVRARALSAVGDDAGCRSSLAEAERALDRSRPIDDPPWMYSFDHGRLTALRGECHLRTHCPEDAEKALAEAIAAAGPTCTRHRAELLSALATAVTRQGRLKDVASLRSRCPWRSAPARQWGWSVYAASAGNWIAGTMRLRSSVSMSTSRSPDRSREVRQPL